MRGSRALSIWRGWWQPGAVVFVTVEGVSHPADPDRDLYESGALLPGPAATLAGPTFEEWLESAS